MDGMTLSKKVVLGAMVEARKIVEESVKKTLDDSLDAPIALTTVDVYEKCLKTMLGLGGK